MLSNQLPRISGILNNCALHACVPELLSAIHYFASVVDGSATEDKKLEKFKSQYENLKNEFAYFYKINPDTLTWKTMHTLLTDSVHNNKFAAQFVMGPVLRRFMESHMNVCMANFKPSLKNLVCRSARLSSENISLLSFSFFQHTSPSLVYLNSVRSYSLGANMLYGSRDFQNRPMFHKTDLAPSTDIQGDGRYPSLEADVVGKYVYAPLGMSLHSYSKCSSADAAYQVIEENDVVDPAFIINIYNEGSHHWERLPSDQVKKVTNDYDKLAMDCQEIERCASTITSENDKAKSSAGIEMLINVVSNQFKILRKAELEKEEMLSIMNRLD